MAPPFVACRMCYKIEGKVRNYKDDEFFKRAYEDLSGCPFDDIQYITKFCSTCATLLKKFHRLRKTCQSGYSSMMDYLNTGRKITHKYVNMQAKWIAKRYSLKNWTVRHSAVIDCMHNPKRYIQKQNNERFYVKHFAVPRDDTELPEIAKIKNKRKTGYHSDFLQLNGGISASDDSYIYSDDMTDDLDVEMPPEISVDPMMNMDPVKVDTVIVEPVVIDPMMNMDPVRVDTVIVEPVVMDPMISVDPVMNMDPVMVDPVVQVGEVKIEEGLNVRNIDITLVQKETEVKSERDPDSLTLQEIKEELQTAVASFVDLENMENVVKIHKKKKGTKKKEKNPKPTKRQIIQAKRYQSNQDLENQFIITQFLTEEQQVEEFLKRREGEGYLEGRFKCDLCLKSFKQQKWMDTHVMKHEPAAGSYVCNICKIRCKTPKLFRTHRDANHTRKYSCKRCAYVTYSKAQALKHHGWHEGVEHTCQHCGATFKKHTTYMGHVRRAHASAHVCGACARSFVSARGLNLHAKAVHKDINKLEKDSTKCEECDITFVSHKMYIKHILITEKHKELSKNMFGCRKCGERFDNRELLEKHTHYKERKHVRRDVPKRSIRCDECDELFTHPNGVYQHHLREHPDKPYQFAIQRHYLCEQCGKTFKSPGLLQQHALIHKGLRPPTAKKQTGRNPCRLCGKTYSKLSGLFRHKLTHLGVRRHKCHICEKAFTDTSNLKQHVQSVHLNIRRTRKR